MSDDTSGGAERDVGTQVDSLDQGTVLGTEEAAAIMQEQDERARQAFRISHRGTFVGWGVIVLLGYGLMWLLARHQHPVHGPDPIAFAVLNLLAVGSALAGRAEARPDAGVGGVSVQRRRIHVLALVVGLGAMYAVEGALYRAGAGRPVLVVFEATAPILVAGLFYLTSSALWLDWRLAAFGLWLAAVAVGGAYAGPAGVWAVDALAAGLAFLFMGVFEPFLRQGAGLRRQFS
jgi:hypothetical protein